MTMTILQSRQFEEPSPCPYLADRQRRYEFFLAVDVSAREVAGLLAAGWRKFGIYYFRPACPDCRQCIPLRVPVTRFRPSRSQRRVLKRCRDLQAGFAPLHPDRRLFEIYRSHAAERFAIDCDWEEFLLHFHLPSCPGLQTEIRRDGALIAGGFLDVGSDCLSSIYFCFDPGYGRYNLGTFGVLQEIDHARRLGRDWYYLGYYVPGCGRMRYKDHFRPREYFHWDSRQWLASTDSPGFAPG